MRAIENSEPPAAGEAWRLGRYLVLGPGHCAECHSPRDFLGGIIPGQRLAGGPLPDGKGKAPSLTAMGLKDWSKSDIEEALSSGFTPSGDSLGGPMAEVVRNTAQLPASYREAIAEYLKSGVE
jgi:mono/diheme cytochrome c family protein